MVAAGCFERGKAKPTPSTAEDAAPAASGAPASAGGSDVGGARPPVGTRDLEGTVSVRLEAEPAHLNPLFRADMTAVRVAMGDVYEGLLCAERVGEGPRPCLAERIEHNDDQTVWTFHLRSGVLWHDGTPFSAADVFFTFGLVRGAAPAPSVLAADFDDIESIDLDGPLVVRVTFRERRVGRRSSLAALPILPAHVFGGVPSDRMAASAPSRAPIGTGPLRFGEWVTGERIVLVRNEAYWGQRALVGRVVYTLVSSRQRAVAALSAGELDVILQMPIDEAQSAVAADSTLQLFAYDSPAYLAAVWNTRRAPLRSAAVRRALGMLLDRAGIVDQVFKGYARYVDGPYLSACNTTAPALPFDRAAAGEALSGAPPEIALLVPTESRTMQRIADIWAADARPHAQLRVERAPYTEVLARARRGEFDGVLLAFTTGVDVDHYHVFHSSQTGAQNYAGLADPALDALLEAIRGAGDDAARLRLEREAHARIVELQPLSFIASDQRVGLARARVGGIAVTADGFAARRVWVAR